MNNKPGRDIQFCFDIPRRLYLFH